MKQIKICGHRGFFEKYPQNTLPSFEAAIEPGCYPIEYDRHLTAEVVAGFHSVDTLVDAWPVDTAEEFRRQAAFGVDSVTSNNPESVLAERNR